MTDPIRLEISERLRRMRPGLARELQLLVKALEVTARSRAHFGQEEQEEKLSEECAEYILAMQHRRDGRGDNTQAEAVDTLLVGLSMLERRGWDELERDIAKLHRRIDEEQMNDDEALLYPKVMDVRVFDGAAELNHALDVMAQRNIGAELLRIAVTSIAVTGVSGYELEQQAPPNRLVGMFRAVPIVLVDSLLGSSAPRGELQVLAEPWGSFELGDVVYSPG